ncbi:hypothetical protein D1872_282440 [compost metagenome]
MADQSGHHDDDVVLHRQPEGVVGQNFHVIIETRKGHRADPVPVHQRVVQRQPDRNDGNPQINDQRREQAEKNRKFGPS